MVIRILIICIFAYHAIGNVLADDAVAEPLPKEYVVRDLLRGYGQFEYVQLWKFGERLFPMYEKILDDPNTECFQQGQILSIIRNVKADRSNFIAPACSRLASPNMDLRRVAAIVLGSIGTERDAAPLVALLDDSGDKPFYFIARRAADSIAAIGGTREVDALNVWLLTNSQRTFATEKDGKDNRLLREYVTKCRDQLMARLAYPGPLPKQQ